MARETALRELSTLMFKYKEDIVPVSLVLALTCLDFMVYLTVDSTGMLAGYWLLMLLPKGVICAWNHHHQHTMTFRAAPLNRLLELVYALHTGVTSHLWVLHHVLGHHHNYLDQRIDESRWARKDGSTMGSMEYAWNVASTAYYRGYQVGKRYPKAQKIFLTFTALTFVLLLALVWFRPLQALFIFLLPMAISLYFTSWVTYDHHSGLHTDDPFEASYNNTGKLFNLLTGNLGYHTAHHLKQGVHWSKLPALHAEIADRIPASLYKPSTFSLLLDRT
jgi:fatty acid desaturase